MKTTIRLLTTAALVLIAVAADPAGVEMVDKGKTFAITAPDGWARDEKSEARNVAFAIVLNATKYEKGKVSPSFDVQTMPAASLAGVSKAILDKAKGSDPDQGDDAKPVNGKLDGEKAVSFIVKLNMQGHKARKRYTLATHKGKTYIVSFTDDPDDYASRSGDADKLFDSFKWK